MPQRSGYIWGPGCPTIKPCDQVDDILHRLASGFFNYLPPQERQNLLAFASSIRKNMSEYYSMVSCHSSGVWRMALVMKTTARFVSPSQYEPQSSSIYQEQALSYLPANVRDLPLNSIDADLRRALPQPTCSHGATPSLLHCLFPSRWPTLHSHRSPIITCLCWKASRMPLQCSNQILVQQRRPWLFPS